LKQAHPEASIAVARRRSTSVEPNASAKDPHLNATDRHSGYIDVGAPSACNPHRHPAFASPESMVLCVFCVLLDFGRFAASGMAQLMSFYARGWWVTCVALSPTALRLARGRNLCSTMMPTLLLHEASR